MHLKIKNYFQWIHILELDERILPTTHIINLCDWQRTSIVLRLKAVEISFFSRTLLVSQTELVWHLVEGPAPYRPLFLAKAGCVLNWSSVKYLAR